MAKEFGDAPGLGDRAHRPVGRLGLEDLADRPQPGVSQMRPEGFDDTPDRRSISVETQVRIEVGSQQPGPRQTHVIGRVAGTLVAPVRGLIARIIRAQRSKAVGNQELRRDHIEHTSRAIDPRTGATSVPATRPITWVWRGPGCWD